MGDAYGRKRKNREYRKRKEGLEKGKDTFGQVSAPAYLLRDSPAVLRDTICHP